MTFEKDLVAVDLMVRHERHASGYVARAVRCRKRQPKPFILFSSIEAVNASFYSIKGPGTISHPMKHHVCVTLSPSLLRNVTSAQAKQPRWAIKLLIIVHEFRLMW